MYGCLKKPRRLPGLCQFVPRTKRHIGSRAALRISVHHQDLRSGPCLFGEQSRHGGILDRKTPCQFPAIFMISREPSLRPPDACLLCILTTPQGGPCLKKKSPCPNKISSPSRSPEARPSTRGRAKTTCPRARPTSGPTNPMSAARSRSGAAAPSITPLACWLAIACGQSMG